MAADECPCLINTLSRAQTCLVVQEVVVGNLEEPRAESAHVLIARTREIGFHQRILCQVVGIALVAATEGEQEANRRQWRSIPKWTAVGQGRPLQGPNQEREAWRRSQPLSPFIWVTVDSTSESSSKSLGESGNQGRCLDPGICHWSQSTSAHSKMEKTRE